MPVSVPQAQQKDSTGKLFQIGGAVVGGIYGGPAGALAGAQVGGLTAGMVQKDPAAQTPEIASGRAAMQRRAQSLQPMEPDQYAPQLAQAEQAAATLPPEMQKEYLPALQRARAMNQGVV